VKVRLNGVDCPASHQAFGTRARQFTGAAVFGKIVRVEVRDRDRYGRLVGDVFTPDGNSLNAELVRAGFAWWYRRYAPKDTKLAALAARAGGWTLGRRRVRIARGAHDAEGSEG
jgi:endonuclease YncB( thermonuclease family)